MPINTADVCGALSSDRLGPYRAHAGGNDLAALQHYQHNILLSESLYAILHLLEVTLRNRFEEHLMSRFGVNWFNDARFSAEVGGKHEGQQLTEALGKLTRSGKVHTSGRVVAELNFGFWTGLLGNSYNGRFWGPAWKTLLRHQNLIDPTRSSTELPKLEKKVNQILRDTRHVRNRLFHHEPIWNDRRLWTKYQDVRLLVSWVSMDVSDWIDHAQLDRFRGVYQQLKGLQP
jgi:hypothetical protein